MAGNDFFVTFGSNAKTFAGRLKADLEPARNEVIALGKLLQGLEQQAGKSVPAVTTALARGVAQGGGGGGSGTAHELSTIHEAVADFRRDLSDLAGQLKTVVAGIKASTGQTGRLAQGRGAYYDPGAKGLVPTADVQAGKYPQAYRMGSLPFDPKLTSAIQQLATTQTSRLTAASPLMQPASIRISDIGKVQLDQAGLDRVVKAVNEVRDEVRKLATRPSAPEAGAPAGAAALTEKGKRQATVSAAQPDVSDPAALRAELERKLAGLEVEAKRLRAVMTQAGEAVDDTLKATADELAETTASTKKELAKLEREATGITRAEQSARRQAEFRRGPDLPEEEYNRRTQMRQRLDLALDPQAFQAAVGTGKGQLVKKDLIEMAQQLSGLGFQTPTSQKLRAPELAKGVIKGRQAMLEQYGPEIPAELQTGRKIVADKVSDAVRQILETANISAAEAAEEFAAREALRIARQAGHLPKEPTLRATDITGEGATALAGQRLSGPIGVPPGMVKGGEYTDVYGVLPAAQMLQQRALGRAANLAMQPGYDPYRVNVSEEISGRGEEAEGARQAFRALRRATAELDDLGRDFQTFADAIEESEKFIDRARARLERAARGEKLSPVEQEKLATDPARIAAAETKAERLRGEMASGQFRGLQEVFEAPEYQAGRREREMSKAMYEAQIEDRARRERQVYTEDALGMAVAGTRLAPGTKETYIRNIPGLMYEGRKDRFAFAPGQELGPQTLLDEMNQAFKSMRGAMRTERGVALDVERGERPQEDLERIRRRVENQATTFLNQMQEIFKVSLPLESLIGRAAESAQNVAAEERRQEASAAVRAQIAPEREKAVPGRPVADVGTREQRAAAKEASVELRDLADELDRATKAQRRLTELRSKIKAGRAAGEDVSALVAEREAIKAAPGYLGRTELKAARKRYVEEMADVQAGGGATPPPPPSGPRTGGGPGGPGGPGGGDGLVPNLLREILTAVNGIHRTIQTGVRVTGAGVPEARPVEAGGGGAPAPPSAAAPAGGTAAGEEQSILAATIEERARAEAEASQSTQNLVQTEKQRAEGQRKNLVLTQAQVRAEMMLTNAKALLNKEAEEQFDELKKLNQAGASNEKIVEQQARAYAAMDAAMTGQGVPAAHRKRYAQSLLTEANVRPGGAQGPRVRMTEVEEIARSSQGFQRYTRQAQDTFTQMAGYAGEEGPFGLALQGMFGRGGFWSRVMASTGTFIVRNFTAGFVFGITNALQEVLRQGIITESTFIKVSDALEQTGRTAGDLRTQLQGISADYGVALNDVYETAAGLTGLFEQIDEIAGATRVVAQLQAISMGALNAKEAMGVLASITGAYADELQGGIDGLEHVADVLTVVQNTLGTNVEVTSEGVGALSGLSQQLKIDFEDMSVYVAQIAKLTNQTGAAAGEQFGRILASMQGGRGRAAIAEALPGTGIEQLIAEGEYGEALKVLIGNWDNLTESQQRNLSSTIAGQRQARAFAALTSNSTKVLNAATAAHNANGQAQQRAEKIAATLNGRIQRLMTNFQNLAQNLIRTGILDFVGVLLAVTNEFLSAINKVFSTLNDLTDRNPLASFFKHVTVGLLGLVVTLKLAGAAFRGFRASLQGLQAGEGAVGAGLRAATGGAAAPKPWQQGFIGPLPAGVERAVPAGAAPASLRQMPRHYGAQWGTSLATRADHTAARAQLAQSATRTRLLQTEAKLLKGASSATAGLGKGLTGLTTAGLGANFAMGGTVLAIMGLVGAYQRQKQAADEVRESIEKYDETGKQKTQEQLEKEYVGPETEAFKQWQKDTEGAWKRFKFYAADMPIQALGEYLTGDIKGGWKAGGGWGNDPHDAWRGVLGEKMQDDLDALDQALIDAISGVDVKSQSKWTDLYLQGVPKEVLEGVELPAAPDVTIADAERAGAEASRAIATAREDLARQYEEEEITEGQYKAMSAELEKRAMEANDRVAGLILFLKGISEAEALSLDVIKRIDQLRPTLSAIQGGDVGLVGEGLEELIESTGTPSGARAVKLMEQMAEGNLTRVEFMRKDYKYVKDAYDNLVAKLRAHTAGKSTLNEEQLDEIEQQLNGKINELAGKTESMIQAFVEESTLLAEAARMRGDYAGAAAALERGLSQVAGIRDRASEPEDVRARRDLQDMQQSQQAAGDRATAKNETLRLAQAREQSATRDAELEVQINRNVYDALLAERDLAREEGRLGPGRAAINEARLAWINSVTSTSQTLQQQQTGIAQAQAALAGAHAEARGDAVAAAQAQAQGARAAMAAAQEAGDRAGVINAQAQLVAANAAEVQAQLDLVQSQYQVSIAIADAAGDALRSAGLTIQATQAALADALRRSGGKETAEINQLRAQLIANNAAEAQAQQDLVQARFGVSTAIADAAGDTVRSARVAAQAARAALADALRRSGGKETAEINQLRAQVIATNAAVSQSEQDLVQSRVQVSIAIADAAGNTVRSAVLQLQGARKALAAALKRSGGKETAEINQLRAEAISQQAAVRDARLQDDLDTIDFNLEMGKMTQSSAISALQEILRTRDLTKQQRRQLLLQIKGMKDEMADSQWNIGDIRLPTPYQMRRYIEQRRQQFRGEMNRAAMDGGGVGATTPRDRPSTTMVTNNFNINGADIAKVRKVIREVVGTGGVNTRTVAARRR